jgi:hypothetical protein
MADKTASSMVSLVPTRDLSSDSLTVVTVACSTAKRNAVLEANLLEARAACEHELARAADTALASAVETEREATIRALQAATAALTARSGGMGQRRRTRRSSVGALTIVTDHRERRGTMVADAEDVEEMRREGLLLAASSTGPKARRGKNGWAAEATRNVVVLVPELAALTIDNEWTLRDWFYGGWRRKMLYELLFRPGAYAFFLVGLLIPVWGPFAVAHMVGRPLSTRVSTTSVACLGNGLSASNGSYAPARVNGSEAGPCVDGQRQLAVVEASGWSEACFVLFAVYSVLMGITAVLVTFSFSSAITRLLSTRGRFNVLLTLGAQLVYTAASISYFRDMANTAWVVQFLIGAYHGVFRDAHIVGQLLRNTKRSTEAGSANVFRFFYNIVRGFEALLEIGRHFAVLYLMDGSSARSATPLSLELLPARAAGERLAITNLNIMSVTFAVYIVIALHNAVTMHRTRGQQLPQLQTRFNVKVVYADAGDDHESSSMADKTVSSMVSLVPTQDVSSDALSGAPVGPPLGSPLDAAIADRRNDAISAASMSKGGTGD